MGSLWPREAAIVISRGVEGGAIKTDRNSGVLERYHSWGADKA